MKIVRTAAVVSLTLLLGLAFSACSTPPTASAPAVTLPMPGPVDNAAPQDYELSELDQKPVPIFQARPIYPVKLRSAGISGQAVVSFVVDRYGNVAEATAVSATEPEFGDAAVASIYRWKFRPGIRNGQAVNTRLQVPINFAVKSQ